MRGDSDPDWGLLLAGVTFGFWVIDSGCDITYSPDKYKRKSAWEGGIIKKKLSEEENNKVISRVDYLASRGQEYWPWVIHIYMCQMEDTHL